MYEDLEKEKRIEVVIGNYSVIDWGGGWGRMGSGREEWIGCTREILKSFF